MRAHEFVREKIAPETTQAGFEDEQEIANGRYTLKAKGHSATYQGKPVNMLGVEIIDNEFERQIAWVDFIVQVRPQDNEPHLVSTSTYVRPEYRGQGLSKIMYQYANNIGNDIEPSRLQTQAGKDMWKGLTKSVRQLPKLPAPATPAPKPSVWQRLRGAVGAKSKEFAESVDADKVLQYVKRVHAPDEFNIEYSITDHPKWELKSIPLSKLKLDPDGEQRDPYNRVNWVDYDKVQDLIPKITSVLKSSPIVVDSQGWIIDGNHRATAAAEAGLKSVPAYVPAAKSINEIAMSGSQLPGQWVQNNNYKKIYDFHTDKNHYRAHFEINDTYDDEDDSVNGKTMFAYFLAQLPNGQWTDNITNINEPDTIKIYSTMAGLIQQILKSQPDISSVSMFGRDRVNNIYQKLLQRNITKLLPGWQVTSQGIERLEPAVAENFADGKVKGKSRPGRVKRAGASCAGSVTDLRAKARKYGGEKGKMYHWCANMKGGKKK